MSETKEAEGTNGMSEVQKIGFKAALALGEFKKAWDAVAEPIYDPTPKGYWDIEAYTNGYEIVVVGYPPNDEDLPPGSPTHNCDQMGCGSLDHVVARIPVNTPTPELEWNGTREAVAVPND